MSPGAIVCEREREREIQRERRGWRVGGSVAVMQEENERGRERQRIERAPSSSRPLRQILTG